MRTTIGKINLLLLMLAMGTAFSAWSQPQSDGKFFAYCSNPPGYYPYVASCKVPWRKVPIQNQENNGQPTPLVDSHPDDNSAPPAEGKPDDRADTQSQVEPVQQAPIETTPPPMATQRQSGSAVPNPLPPVETPPERRGPNPKPESDIAGYIVGPLLFALALIPVFLTHRGILSQPPNEAVILALRRWPLRKSYIWTIGVVSALLAVRFSPSQPILIAGAVAVGFVLFLFARARIDDNQAPSGSAFPEAGRQIASLKAVAQHNHFESLQLRWVSKFQGLSSPNPFLAIFNSSRILIITPVRYWVRIGTTYSTGPTHTVRVRAFDYKLSTGTPHSDDVVKGTTWRHATKSGQPDRRFKDNPQTFLIVRFGVEILLFDDLSLDLAELTKLQCDQTVAAFNSFLVRLEKTYSET